MVVDDPNSLKIISFPHPTLRYKAKPIKRVDANLAAIIKRMFELMYEHRGVGLAATQVGLPIRLFVMNETADPDDGEEVVMINPVISRFRGNEEGEEGCLSLPNLSGNVVRGKKIHVTAYTPKGEEIDQDFEGYVARIIQHEVDHLDGALFIDRMREEALQEQSGELEVLKIDFDSRRKVDDELSDESVQAFIASCEERYC